jgi:glucose/arabinose dehydrogenase
MISTTSPTGTVSAGRGSVTLQPPPSLYKVSQRTPGGIQVHPLCLLAMIVLITIVGAGSASVHAQDDLVPHRLRIPLTDGTRTVTLSVASGFDIGLAATDVPSARMIVQSPTGDLILSQTFEGKVSRLVDHNGDGIFEERISILRNLEMPHGLAFIGDVLFVATSDRILRLDPWWDGSSVHEVVQLPGGGQHVTRTLAAGPDGTLYVSIGSTCDACVENDTRRATVLRLDANSGSLEPVARGMRNAVGMAWNPNDSQLWVTENGRNDLGDDIPPDEIDVVRTGLDYGWPDCYAGRLPATPDVPPERCAATEPAVLTLPAHSAPLGLAFYEGEHVPPEYRGNLFVALHGSAERSTPIGYELVRAAMQDGHPQAPVPFVRGWLAGNNSWGRPVDPFVARDGTLYVTDDKGGVIYWIKSSGEDR